MRRPTIGLCGLLLALAGPAASETFRYDSGPPPGVDTTLSVATSELEPIVRARGPKVPLTNLQLVTLVAKTAFDRGLTSAPLDSGSHVTIAPAEAHPLNFVIEHSVLRHLARRGITATVRRGVIPDDSVMAVAGNPGDPLLEYQLASARITYLRLRGWLPGRVKIERQALVEGALTLRDPVNARVLWTGDAGHNLVDAFPRNQVQLVEDKRFTELAGEVPGRTVDKVLEPVIVVAIVAGLVLLFFENRP
jgi:hypothetical protein